MAASTASRLSPPHLRTPILSPHSLLRRSRFSSVRAGATKYALLKTYLFFLCLCSRNLYQFTDD
jgi:hypothetical protein